MRTTNIFPVPTSVTAVDDGSSRCRTMTMIADQIGRRFDIPAHRLPLDNDLHRPETVASLASNNTALVVAAVRSTERRGSLGRALATSAKLPWLAIGPGLRSVVGSGPGILTVPVDGTAEVDALVPTALAWATAFDLAVHLVAVLPDGPGPRRDGEPTPADAFSIDPDAHLQHLGDQGSDVVTLKTDVLRDPIGVASAMERYLRETPEALLVAPSRWRGVHTMLRGTSTSAIVRSSPVPVLVAPNPSASSRR